LKSNQAPRRDGRHIRIEKAGKMRICFKGRERKTTEALLENVVFFLEMKVNHFSLTVAMEKGASLYSEGISVEFTKVDTKICFDTKSK
jgi:hypothetical protein